METFKGFCENEDWEKELNVRNDNTVFETTNKLLSMDGLSILEDIEDKLTNQDCYPNSLKPIKTFKQLNNKTIAQTYYQSALVNKIVKSNSILLLDKFEGRIFTMILVFRELSQEIFGPFYRHLPSWGSKRTGFRRSVILCSAELLEHYQYNMQKYLPKNLHTRIVSRSVKKYDYEWFEKIIEETHVLIMTNTVIEQFLNMYMNISDFNIIAFEDVCYHPLQKNNKISDIYQMSQCYSYTKCKPRILALSKCVIFGLEIEPDIGILRQQFGNLSNQLNAFIVTSARSLGVCKNKKDPIYLILSYSNRETIGLHHDYEIKLSDYRSYIKEISQKTKNTSYYKDISCLGYKNENIDVILSILTDIDSVLRDVGYWGSYISSVYFLKYFECMYNDMNITNIGSAMVNLFRILRNYIRQVEIHEVPTLNDISDKFTVFIRQLKTYYGQVQFSSIILVDNILLEYIITFYFQELAGKFPEYRCFKIQSLYGANSGRPPFRNNTREHYYKIIEMFRVRKINIIVIEKTVISTFDMPRCNTIVFFNSLNNFSFFKQTLIPLEESHLNYLCLTSNEEKSQMVSLIQLCVKNETLYNEIIEKDILTMDMQNTIEDLHMDKYQTNGAVSFHNAESILEAYCQSLVGIRDRDMYTVTKPIYKLKQRKQTSFLAEIPDLEYTYEILLPKSLYMIECIQIPEKWSNSKLYAKRFAAFSACTELYDRGEITESATSKVKSLKQRDNSKESVGYLADNGTQIYPLKVANCLQLSIISNRRSYFQSYFFEETISNPEPNSYITSFALISESALDLHKLPAIVLTNINKWSDKDNSRIRFLEPTQIILSESEIESIHLFNSTLFQIILENMLSIEYDYNNSRKRYLIVPTRIFTNVNEDVYRYSSNIDFELLKRLKNWPFFNKNFSIEGNESYYKGMIVKTKCKPNNVSHKADYLYVIDSDRKTTIDSAIPENTKVSSYREYFMKFHNITLTNSNQLSLLCKPFPNKVLNRFKTYQNNSRIPKEICKKKILQKLHEEIIIFPELISPVPLLNLLNGDYQAIPSICRRVESFLLAREFCKNIQVELPIWKCLTALTLKRAEEGFHLERLEFFGDPILTYIVVNHLFLIFPYENQGVLSYILSNRVKNSLLLKFSLSEKINLAEFVTGREFDPKSNWLPPGFGVKSTLRNDSESFSFAENRSYPNFAKSNLHDTKQSVYTHQELSDKSIADSFEALVATIFSTRGLPHILRFLYQFDKESVIREIDSDLIDTLSTQMIEYSDNFSSCKFHYYLQGKECFRYIYSRYYKPCYWSVETYSKYLKCFQNTHEVFAKKILKLEKQLDRENLYTLVQALTHDSYIINSFTPSYHRLMFLGEAIICYLIASYIMTNTSEKYQPKDLHIIKTCVLQNSNLARICLNKGIQEYILITNPQLHTEIEILSMSTKSINEYDFFQEQLSLVSQCISGKNKVEDSVNDSLKVLADIYKSMIGCIYIITEYNLVQVWDSFGEELSQSVTKVIQLYSKV